MDGHGGPSVFDMCRIEQGGDLRCAEHRQISLRGWLLVVLADGIVRVTAGRAGIRRERTSTSRPAETWAPMAATASGVLRRRAVRWSLIRSEGRAGRHGRGRAGHRPTSCSSGQRSRSCGGPCSGSTIRAWQRGL